MWRAGGTHCMYWCKTEKTENRDGQKSVILARLSMILVNMILSSTHERKELCHNGGEVVHLPNVVEGETSNNHRFVVKKVATVIFTRFILPLETVSMEGRGWKGMERGAI